MKKITAILIATLGAMQSLALCPPKKDSGHKKSFRASINNNRRIANEVLKCSAACLTTLNPSEYSSSTFNDEVLTLFNTYEGLWFGCNKENLTEIEQQSLFDLNKICNNYKFQLNLDQEVIDTVIPRTYLEIVDIFTHHRKESRESFASHLRICAFNFILNILSTKPAQSPRKASPRSIVSD